MGGVGREGDWRRSGGGGEGGSMTVVMTITAELNWAVHENWIVSALFRPSAKPQREHIIL